MVGKFINQGIHVFVYWAWFRQKTISVATLIVLVYIKLFVKCTCMPSSFTVAWKDSQQQVVTASPQSQDWTETLLYSNLAYKSALTSMIFRWNTRRSSTTRSSAGLSWRRKWFCENHKQWHWEFTTWGVFEWKPCRLLHQVSLFINIDPVFKNHMIRCFASSLLPE